MAPAFCKLKQVPKATQFRAWAIRFYLSMAGLKRHTGQGIDTREPGGIGVIFAIDHHSHILQKIKAQRKFRALPKVKWLRELNVGFLLPNSLLSSGF